MEKHFLTFSCIIQKSGMKNHFDPFGQWKNLTGFQATLTKYHRGFFSFRASNPSKYSQNEQVDIVI